jgi:hypothetical protein
MISGGIVHRRPNATQYPAELDQLTRALRHGELAGEALLLSRQKYGSEKYTSVTC